jgi:hypothetical protein
MGIRHNIKTRRKKPQQRKTDQAKGSANKIDPLQNLGKFEDSPHASLTSPLTLSNNIEVFSKFLIRLLLPPSAVSCDGEEIQSIKY